MILLQTGGSEGAEVEWPKVEVTFDQDGVSAITNSDLTSQVTQKLMILFILLSVWYISCSLNRV